MQVFIPVFQFRELKNFNLEVNSVYTQSISLGDIIYRKFLVITFPADENDNILRTLHQSSLESNQELNLQTKEKVHSIPS